MHFSITKACALNAQAQLSNKTKNCKAFKTVSNKPVYPCNLLCWLTGKFRQNRSIFPFRNCTRGCDARGTRALHFQRNLYETPSATPPASTVIKTINLYLVNV